MKPNNKKNQKKVATMPQQSAESDESFESPNPGNETDYDLDYTNTLFEPRTPRRSLTLQHTHIEDGSSPETDSDDENYVPAPARRTSSNVSQRPSNQRPETSNTRTTRGNLPAPSRRKRRKPENLAAKMNREIAVLRSRVDNLIPRLPFSRVVREIMFECSNVGPLFITRSALEAIQTSAEMYLTQRFEDAYLLTRFRSRVTLEIRDMALVAYFCKTYGKA